MDINNHNPENNENNYEENSSSDKSSSSSGYEYNSSTYQPNWTFPTGHTPAYYEPEPEPAAPKKSGGGAKYVVISVIINLIITLIICSLLLVGFLYFRKRTSVITNENGSLVIFRDGDDLRDKTDMDENMGTLASDGTQQLSTQEIARKVGPAVVGIVSTGETEQYYFYSIPSQSSGSGVIISEDGYIVTNNHVIEGAEQITVILNTKEEYAAKVVGADPRTDLAVLKIEATGLTWASLGNSGDVQVGEPVVAIGNPLGMELAGTVTKGIISATNRMIEVEGQSFVLLQTDAAINSGNSGGALVNAYGEVIGINSAKLQATGVEGLSFAIPSDVAKPIIQDLMEVGYVKGRPIIGLIGDDISKEEAEYYGLSEGILVMSITRDSAAHKAGIQRGDLIIKCQGQDVKTVQELNAIRDQYKAGDQITLTVIRNDETIDIPLILGEEVQSQQ